MNRPFFERYAVVLGASALLVFGMLAIVTSASIAPSDFVPGTTVTISKDSTLGVAADRLAEAHVVKSARAYKASAVLLGRSRSLQAGTYVFDEPQSVIRVAYRTTHGIQGRTRVKVTIPEGSDADDIAWIMLKAIPGFDAPGFLSLAREHEGMLFPDTYFFYEHASPAEVVDALRSLYEQKVAGLRGNIVASGHSERELIVMASILEREAATETDRRMVADILWRRLEEGMPLQVDAPFWHIFRKGTKDLTSDDLKIDSPYNTYRYRGLPPAPISNPGLEAIMDALEPTPNSYVYYLSDMEGNMHYASTLEEHAENKRKYL